MSTNCIHCVINDRTGPDLLCTDCRRPIGLLNDLKAVLGFDDREKLTGLVAAITRTAYDAGFVDALGNYAYMKDGTSYVGTTGRTLREAIKDRKRSAHYLPRG